MEDALRELAARLGGLLLENGLVLACAESCTGGLLSSLLTDIPGSSAWFAGSVVAYANAAKRDILGVSQAILDAKGAVSREAVLAMARGARGILRADMAVAVSGIAGPTGGSPQKPVGTVWLAWEGPFGVDVKRVQLSGSRLDIKRQSAHAALEGLLSLVKDASGGRGAAPDPVGRG